MNIVQYSKCSSWTLQFSCWIDLPLPKKKKKTKPNLPPTGFPFWHVLCGEQVGRLLLDPFVFFLTFQGEGKTFLARLTPHHPLHVYAPARHADADGPLDAIFFPLFVSRPASFTQGAWNPHTHTQYACVDHVCIF